MFLDLKFFFLCLLCFFSSTADVEIGSCGDRAVCIEEANCSFILKVIGAPPIPFIYVKKNSVCGFSNRGPKVCCPKSEKTEKPKSLPQDDCGFIPKKFIAKRIFHGTHAELTEFPWMALIAFKTELSGEEIFKCAGTLVSKWYVLTAGHCTEKQIKFIRLGEYNINSDPDCNDRGECQPMVQDLSVSKVITHPEYNLQTWENDIALIKLKTAANIRSNVLPVCLPHGLFINKKNLLDEPLIASGWGVTESGTRSSILKKAFISTKSMKTCLNLYKIYGMPFSNKQICGLGQQGQDTCEGDSGGPLHYITTVKNSQRYVQTGIISYGHQCGIRQPAVYTNVKAYMSWILSIIEHN